MSYQSLLVLSLLCIFSCKTPSKTDNSPSTEKPSQLIKFSKGPCFGQCPIFSMSVNTDGSLSYHGIRFTKKQGIYAKKLNKVRLEALKAEIKKAKLWEKEAKYTSGLSDLQKISLECFKADKTKKIEGDGNAIPSVIQDLIQSLDLIANSSGWKLIKKAENTKEENPNIIQNEIIIQLKKSANIKEWINVYKTYDLVIKERISPSLNMWLLQFDRTKILPQQLLNQIKASEQIVNAEFNKNLTQRN